MKTIESHRVFCPFTIQTYDFFTGLTTSNLNDNRQLFNYKCSNKSITFRNFSFIKIKKIISKNISIRRFIWTGFLGVMWPLRTWNMMSMTRILSIMSKKPAFSELLVKSILPWSITDNLAWNEIHITTWLSMFVISFMTCFQYIPFSKLPEANYCSQWTRHVYSRLRIFDVLEDNLQNIGAKYN